MERKIKVEISLSNVLGSLELGDKCSKSMELELTIKDTTSNMEEILNNPNILDWQFLDEEEVAVTKIDGVNMKDVNDIILLTYKTYIWLLKKPGISSLKVTEKTLEEILSSPISGYTLCLPEQIISDIIGAISSTQKSPTQDWIDRITCTTIAGVSGFENFLVKMYEK